MRPNDYITDYLRRDESRTFSRPALIALTLLPMVLLAGGFSPGRHIGDYVRATEGLAVFVAAIGMLTFPLFGAAAVVSILIQQQGHSVQEQRPTIRSALFTVDLVTFFLLILSLAVWAGIVSALFAVLGESRTMYSLDDMQGLRAAMLQYEQMMGEAYPMLGLDGVLGLEAIAFSMLLCCPMMLLGISRKGNLLLKEFSQAYMTLLMILSIPLLLLALVGV